MHRAPKTGRTWAGLARLAAALAGAAALAACHSILDVHNPNNVGEESLTNPAAATAIVNGAGASVTRAIANALGPYSTVTDEVTWVGSRDAFLSLDNGFVSDPYNEFTDDAYPYVSEARFTADQAVTLLEGFDKNNQLATRSDLARAYLYAGIIYVVIADSFDDFVISSSKDVAGQPVGENNMSKLYDISVADLDKGLAIATATNNTALRTAITAMRARAKFDKAIWNKIKPARVVPSNPYATDAGAVADANAALTLMAGQDYKFKFTPLSQTLSGNNVGNELNNRLELRAGDGTLGAKCGSSSCDKYVVPIAAGNRVATVKYQDPVDKISDPVLTANVTECCIKGAQNGQGDLVPMTIVSAREMYLILAEDALARGSNADFVTNINKIRALDKLTPYNGTSPTPRDMLVHERFVNLFLQGRRLADMYRFGIKSDKWSANATAATKVGCFLPITATERLSNPNVTSQPVCGLGAS